MGAPRSCVCRQANKHTWPTTAATERILEFKNKLVAEVVVVGQAAKQRIWSQNIYNVASSVQHKQIRLQITRLHFKTTVLILSNLPGRAYVWALISQVILVIKIPYVVFHQSSVVIVAWGPQRDHSTHRWLITKQIPNSYDCFQYRHDDINLLELNAKVWQSNRRHSLDWTG